MVTVALMLVALGLFGGSTLLSAAYNNAGTLVLAKELLGATNNLFLSSCEPQLEESGAAATLEKALAFNPENGLAWLRLGQVHWLTGNCEGAMQTWERAVRLQPGNTLAWLELGLAYLALERQSDAIRAFSQAEAQRYLYLQGQEADRSGDYLQAISWYEMSVTLEETKLALEALARDYQNVGRASDAIWAWRKLAEITLADDPAHWKALGRAAELEQDWGTALAAYERGAKLTEDSYSIFAFRCHQAYICKWIGDFTRARHYVELAAKAQPSSMGGLYLEMGHLEHRQRDYDAAMSWYSRANAIDPQSALPELYQGVTALEQGDLDGAESFLQAALAQDQKSPDIYYHLGQCAHERGDLERAIAYLRQAIALHPGRPWDWKVALGDWLVEADRLGDAVEVYRQALQQQPGEEGILERLRDLEQD